VLDSVLADLRARGYEVDRPADAGEPPALATGGDDGGPLDGPVAVEPVACDPAELVERAAHAARHDRATLYVVRTDDAAGVREMLAEPRFVAAERDGLRTFYHVPDRIQLSDGSYAAVKAAQPTPRRGELARESANRVLTWREEPATESPTLVLEVNRRPTATLDSVDALICPGPGAVFPYRYARREGSFCVFDADREVGRFGGVAAMRTSGYQPVPMPLVPEHHLRWGTPAMGVAVVDGDSVTYDAV
jgi:hypothetical protein